MQNFRALLGFAFLTAATHLNAQTSWHDRFLHALPLLGRHNWIVVAEPAFPLRSTEGMEMVATDLSQADLMTAVLEAVARAPQVRPVFYTASELPSVPEQDAHGIGAYRAQLKTILRGQDISVPQDQIMAKLDDASRSYHIVVLKSTTMLPYTSVFIELDSGYWTTDAEKRLRAATQPK